MQDDRKCLLLDLLMFRSMANLNTEPELFRMLWNSAYHSQIHVFKDKYERLSGYVAWANFSKEAMLLMVMTRKMPRNIGEWNEGKFLFVVDVVLKKGTHLNVARLIEQLPRSKYVVFLKKGFLYVVKPREGLRPVLKHRFSP